MYGVSRRAVCLWGVLFARAASGAQDTSVDSIVVAKLNAAISARGALEASVEVTAGGSRRAAYREAFSQKVRGVPVPELFGRFLQIRPLDTAPVMLDADDASLPLRIQFRVREDDFLLPIQRQKSLYLDVLPLILPFTTNLGGTIQAVPAGRLREEIGVAIPAGFTTRVGAPVNEDRTFAQYRSETKIEGGRLVMVRELVLKQAVPGDVSRTDLEGFAGIVRADQEKPVILRRISRAHAAEWIQSVPLYRANEYGIIAYQQREFDAARQLYARVLEVNPADLSAWNNLGRALAAMGDLEGAEKAYQKQIALNPNDRYSYNNLGLVEERLGHWDRAVENLRKQIEVHPGDSYATANLPRALIHAGRWAEAETAASKALAAQPNNAQHRLNLSVARVCQGKVANPRQELDTALSARPSASILNNAAYYLAECGQEYELAGGYIQKALDLLESETVPPEGRSMPAAITRQVAISTYLDTYGWLLFRQEKADRAVNLLTAAVALAPRAELYAHLAQAEAKSGQRELVARHWREATFLEAARMREVPADIASQLSSIETVSPDRIWYPLPDGWLTNADLLPAGQPSYFFVTAGLDGKVQSARALDSDDPVARMILPAVRSISFPVVTADGRPQSTVHLVKVTRESNGKVVAARSVAPEAVAIAGELAPAEFPLPVTTTPAAPSGAVATAAQGVNPPRILEQEPPRYSEEARKAGLAGRVQVVCVVGSDGVARDFKVVHSLGLGLDESAIRAVSAWRFAPGVKDGKPVNVASSVDVNFRMFGRDGKPTNWRLARVQFESVPGVTRPVVETAVPPRVSGDMSKGTAIAKFDVDEQGNAVDVRVEQSSDQVWAKDVGNALHKWRFTPALRDGVPVRVSCTMEFERGNS